MQGDSAIPPASCLEALEDFLSSWLTQNNYSVCLPFSKIQLNAEADGTNN
jgi:hypothetical protein